MESLGVSINITVQSIIMCGVLQYGCDLNCLGRFFLTASLVGLKIAHDNC